MAKRKTKLAKRSPVVKRSVRPDGLTPLLIAAAFIVVGITGLLLANRETFTIVTKPTPHPDLTVIEGTDRDPRANQPNADLLYNPARVKDLIQDRPGESVQRGSGVGQGTSVETLLEDKEIR